MQRRQVHVAVILASGAVLTLTACGRGGDDSAVPAAATPVSSTAATPALTPTPTPTATTPRPKAAAAPRKGPNGAARAAVPFRATVGRIPSAATVKYSWRSGCPVPLSGLRLVQMTYWGFDARPHTGRMVVNARVSNNVVKVFKRLYDQRYPIRRMELVDVYKGSDFNSIEADNTSAFNCRAATGSTKWSQHSYGLAIDINPCENPYVTSSGHVDHPRCVKYKNRARRDPGLIHAGDKVVQAFRSIGWGWGGSWSGTKDYQHFSSTGG